MKFIYNNVLHTLIKMTLFYILYRQYSYMLINIEIDILEKETSIKNMKKYYNSNSAIN
jgi:hypothetical protein